MITSRWEFLVQVGGAAAGMLWAQQPELILYNGNIITVEGAQPRAQAIAVSGERIVAVGSNKDVRALARAGTRQVDLGRKTVVPGFIDAHSHPGFRAGCTCIKSTATCGRSPR